MTTPYQPTSTTLKSLQTKHNLSASTIIQFLKYFNVFDKNSDGVISVSELRQVIQLITPHLTQKPTDSEVEDMVRAVDQNQDNMIQFEEFVALMANKKITDHSELYLNVGNGSTLSVPITGNPIRSNSDSGISRETTTEMENLSLDKIFEIFDKDRDGFISRKEISDVMFELGEPVTELDIDNMTLGKQSLNFDQFKQVITEKMDIFFKLEFFRGLLNVELFYKSNKQQQNLAMPGF